MPDLKRYRAKRIPERTPEPFGEETTAPAPAAGAPHAFVVQQHDARNMHWDLRLEIDGVLVSWAVPKGPSLDPKQKRLAVQTEDHPLEYADFEGIIPSGNYGAGAMIVWDRGIYRTADGRSPVQGLEKGKLDLILNGHKLSGRFALVRTRGENGRSWLLLCKGDRPADAAELVQTEPASVFSGLTVHELREGVSRKTDIERALRRLQVPRRKLDLKALRPMLAGTEDAPFSREGWLFELKYDGVRVLAGRTGDGDVRLYTRTGTDRTTTYPEVARALGHLPVDEFVLDGEVVALDEIGRSSFELLQKRFTQTDPDAVARACAEIPVVLYAFDLLSVSGHDLRDCGLRDRKEILSLFAPRRGQVRFADHVEGDGEALFEAAREHGLEGVVAKKADARYQTGRRSKSWLKLKVPRTAELAIVGYVRGRGSRKALGSLMLAWRRGGELVYAGNAGSGLSERTIEELLPQLESARLERPAFAGAPEAPAREHVYVGPELVCEVRYTEVTRAGLLRHPVFLRLCEHVDPMACEAPLDRSAIREAAPMASPPEPGLRLTHVDKVFWPIEGYSKGDLLAYYEAAWPWLKPYLRDRPVVLTRYPDGIEGKHFYQKNVPDFTPAWAQREQIEGTDYFICNDLRTLLYVINSGAIPLHVWSARRGELDRPDWLILDLDPKAAPFRHVVEVARHIHRLLDELGAANFVKTSGQDGLHVLVPLGARLEHKDARTLGEVLARAVCAELPEIATIARPRAARGGKVYVDYLQNGRGKLIAAPFSVRPRPHAPVSTPLSWSQVSVRLDPARWTIKTALPRIKRSGDPLSAVLGEPVNVEALLGGLTERLVRAVAE
ncbi:MAG: DNA ligase D [Deltaproteobacteria bacterium]|nr:DNA ligase D [Deltaproteobacteria bacterium]